MRRRLLFVPAFAVALLLIAAAIVFSRLGSATFQEGNPLPFLAAVDQLDHRSRLVTVGGSSRRWLSTADAARAQPSAMTSMLGGRGWRLQDQMGAGFDYSRGAERLRVDQRMYTGHYVVYRLSRDP